MAAPALSSASGRRPGLGMRLALSVRWGCVGDVLFRAPVRTGTDGRGPGIDQQVQDYDVGGPRTARAGHSWPTSDGINPCQTPPVHAGNRTRQFLLARFVVETNIQLQWHGGQRRRRSGRLAVFERSKHAHGPGRPVSHSVDGTSACIAFMPFLLHRSRSVVAGRLNDHGWPCIGMGSGCTWPAACIGAP